MATKQQRLHREALRAIARLETLIDELKSAGPCPLDRRNALLNTHEQIKGLLNRFPPNPQTGEPVNTCMLGQAIKPSFPQDDNSIWRRVALTPLDMPPLAKLPGTRLMFMDEPNAGAAMDEGLVKALTNEQANGTTPEAES
ncbi:hypothetical protein TSH58p_07340 [Azospirillum sp. TSH58]|uniref:hypothetical protein n=1 Tax=Azospirillum sp. TSH58 TaxID=664962 RepID=UPI000D6008E6|nr:hypothetical protein [Azospirillum sp. TSH58]AWJ83358.1 hypothetical protein TSH58p_07340 [Azospirillum sp. TSH58]PWC73105.1 hypothetical protein TSH58_05295 [Azospirillum sp. TSH58]